MWKRECLDLILKSKSLPTNVNENFHCIRLLLIDNPDKSPQKSFCRAHVHVHMENTMLRNTSIYRQNVTYFTKHNTQRKCQAHLPQVEPTPVPAARMETHHFKSGFSLGPFFICVLFEHEIPKGKCRISDSGLRVCLSAQSIPTGSRQSSRNKGWRKMGRKVGRSLPRNFALDKMHWSVGSGRTCRHLPCLSVH